MNTAVSSASNSSDTQLNRSVWRRQEVEEEVGEEEGVERLTVRS